MSDEIPIPPEACHPKPWFSERPSDALITEIKSFIAKTGTPYLWRGHTHTKPVKGTVVVYVGEFDLPASHQAEDRWAPCPCCRPQHPKYFRGGKIAWFPAEHLIRMIGPKCFAAINASGHREALQEFREEEQRKKDISYLLSNLHIVPQAMRALERAIPAITAFDTVGHILRTRIDQYVSAPQPFWNYVRDGTLSVTETQREVRRLSDGSHETRSVDVLKRFADLPGYAVLNPKGKALRLKLDQVLITLKGIEQFAPDKDTILNASDKERRELAKRLERGMKAAKEIYAAFEDGRALLMPTGIAALKGWSRHPACPVGMFVAQDGNAVILGQTEAASQRLLIPQELFTVLPPLPRLGQTEVAA